MKRYILRLSDYCYVPILAAVISSSHAAVQSDLEYIVPSAKLPASAEINTSNNNLDVIKHNGDLYFVWRTSKNHFASRNTRLQVLRKPAGADQWLMETNISTGKDLREPRFLSLNGELFLYFAELGSNALAFEPGRTLMQKRLPDGRWSAITTIFDDGFIPWRIHHYSGQTLMIGYRGGENIYQANNRGVKLSILTTEDGIHWLPAFGADGQVLSSGVSETDFVFTEKGLVAVGRNEAGDSDGWGSKICRAAHADLAKWTCKADPRKFDSPLMLSQDGNTYLIARRQVAFDGRYDLGFRQFSYAFQNIVYQANYWWTPKRCSLWRVDEESLSVEWIEDLPSAGDTCFPSAIENADGSYDIYNYTSDFVNHANGPWLRGQLNPTSIYKVTVDFRY